MNEATGFWLDTEETNGGWLEAFFYLSKRLTEKSGREIIIYG